MEQKDLMQFGTLMVALFVIAIMVVVTYIGLDYLKESACESNSGTAHVWVDGVCQNTSSDASAITITAVTKATVVEGVVDVALGLLALVVLISIFKVIIKVARGFQGSQ